jgi:indolepyruvate ferredoxin oxidoreductase
VNGAAQSRSPYELADRYRPGAYPVLLSGIQAVARLLAEQHNRDAAAGLRTASLVSGYPGSPLAGLDRVLAGARSLQADHDVHLVPGLNEEIAATTVWGSQLELPGRARSRDGIVGVWYGKAPGVDRAGDALRHGNALGAHPRGGVLVLAGDDPAAKSSTLPCVSERTLAAYGLPVVYPRNSDELITFGLYGIALSRASGCWVGVKVAADVADGLWRVNRSFTDLTVTVPVIEQDGAPWFYQQRTMAAPPASLLAEQELTGPRWEMVRAFAALNPVNELVADPSQAWLGIVAPGKTYDDTMQALHDLGLDPGDVALAGIRVLRVGMPYPLDPGMLRRFACGLQRILVVEEKTAFVESQVRELLYGTLDAPVVAGKRDESGGKLIPADGELTVGRLAGPLRRVLGARLALPEPRRDDRQRLTLLPVARTPYFCSGCPHNRSTIVPEGSLAGGGIGCHAMAAVIPRAASAVTGVTQMGGEGAQWIGQAPFTDAHHLFQNVGDGTLFHSGQLAVQACVAAGVNITFKILYNTAVAMTGGQAAEGALPVPALTRKLRAEGVRRIIVCADEPGRYRRRAGFAPGVDVWHRNRLDEAQRILRDIPGVTALIYDQRCAAEARRLRRRKQLPDRPMRVVINEAVCEGCGDCGRKSNCLSVQPVDTEYGRKAHIDQSSCNSDYSCLDGDCPSFVTVEAGPGTAERRATPEPPAVPEPVRAELGSTYNVLLAGVGGTGVVTVNQILATAALIAGLDVCGLDQTGLSQKAGPVSSHLRLAPVAAGPANRVSPAGADCYLAFDLLVGVDPGNLRYADPARTVAVVSTSRLPTGAMVYDASLSFPDQRMLEAALRRSVRKRLEVDATAAALALFGDSMQANLLLVGLAYQAGMLPMPADAIETAIGLNGAAVEANLAAFRWGRVAVATPDVFAAATHPGAAPASPPRYELADSPLSGETRRLTEIRAADLAGYQGGRTARRYIAFIERVWAAERGAGPRTELSEAVARGLHKLAAYKDEYEVARLLTSTQFQRRLEADLPGGRRVRYRLHPPVLRALGLRRKIALGRGWRPVLRLLAHGRWLRGTPLDPFGYSRVRRLERTLLRQYQAMIGRLICGLDTDSYGRAVEAARAANLIRGYEQVKIASVGHYRARLTELGIAVDVQTPQQGFTSAK